MRDIDDMQKLKIAMIGHKRVPGRDGGGVEVVVEEISTRLALRGHDLTLYNRYRRNDLHPKKYNGVRLINTFTINSKNWMLSFILA